MNPMGAAIAVATILIGLYVKFAKSSNDAAAAQQRLKEIEDEANRNTADEVGRIDRLRRTIEDETVSVNNRRKAIEELQSIVPDYHASISEEGKLYGHNINILKNYTEQLKNSAKIKAALDKLPDAEKERDEHFNNAPSNIQNAWFNEHQGGMDESQAMASASVSPTAYRAWKRQQARLDAAVNQYNSIVDSLTAENQRLADATSAEVAKGSGDSKGDGGGFTPADETQREERFKAEKEWKAREEALNRISYATGQQNYEQYRQRILAIEEEFQKKILARQDLTEQERLEAQAAFHESLKKQTEEQGKASVSKENELYNEAVAAQKQRYIDGEVEQEVYQQTLELLELNHLRRMVALYKEGSAEHVQAQKAYPDRLIADQKKRQQETEAAERKHQELLAQLKRDYFGYNPDERMNKYMTDLEALKEVYQLELQAAGENADERLRIEESFQEAQKALRQKYAVDMMDDNKVFLEEWAAHMQEWLQSDIGQSVTGSLEVLSSSMGSIFTQLSSLIQAETNIQVSAIEKRYKTEIENAEGNNYKVKKLERQKQAEIAKIKNEANKKMFAMQVIQAVAQTAVSAINAYSSAAAVPYVGFILAPIAAAAAITAGAIQVAAIKKQQEASEAQGYAEGGFTGEGRKYEVAGVVHKGEWVASQGLLKSPVARPLIEALDYAQRTNTIGSLGSEDVSRTIVAPALYGQGAISRQWSSNSSSRNGADGQLASTVIVQQPADSMEGFSSATMMQEYTDIMRQLKERLDEPFVTVNTVTGDTGIKQAQDEYEQLMRNKTPKSRRK
jgi:hypothetical protein